MRFPSWGNFKSNWADSQQIAMENLARMLFRKKYNIQDSLPYYHNHPGNETDTIQVGNDVIGFQSKYFKDSIDDKQIIESMKKAKNNNPNQTIYVIYTNYAFGTNKGHTPKSKQNIENEASNLSLTIEWMFGDNILDLVAKDELIYNLFFNPYIDLVHFEEHIINSNHLYLNGIKDDIITKDSAHIKIDRSKYVEQLKCSNTHIVVLGESGSGKSAIVKQYLEECGNIFFCINANELSTNNIDDIFHLEKSYSFGDFRLYYKDFENKFIFVDSVEKVLEFQDSKVLQIFFSSLSSDNWKFVLTSQTRNWKSVYEILGKYLNNKVDIVNVSNLSDEEVNYYLISNNTIRPSDGHLYDRIHNLFYFSRYLEFVGNDNISVRQFRDQVWNSKIKGNGRLSFQEAREVLVLEMIRRFMCDVNYLIKKDSSLDSESVGQLIQDGIIIPYKYYGYTFVHDIFVDWGVEISLDNIWMECNQNAVSFLQSLNSNVRIVNSFRHWLKDMADSEEPFVSVFVQLVIEGRIDDIWSEAIMSAVLRSDDYSKKLFDGSFLSLELNNYYWFRRILDVVFSSCQEVEYKSINGCVSPSPIPVGKVWTFIINFIYVNYEDYSKIGNNGIFKILNAFGLHRTNEHKYEAGVLALKPFVYTANQRNNGDTVYFYDGVKQLCNVVSRYYSYIYNDIRNIIMEAIRDNGNHYKELIDYIVYESNPFQNIVLYKMIPDEMIGLYSLYWKNDDEENSRLNEYKYWNINDNFYLHNVGAHNTGVNFMCKFHFEKTIDFVISFMNEQIDFCSKVLNLDKIELTLPNSNKIELLGNQDIWNIYRGTCNNVPCLISSIHMAVEEFLLMASRQGHFGIVKKCFDLILVKSKSLSLVAIMSSVISAYPYEYYDYALILFSSLQCFKFDLGRFSSEKSSSICEWQMDKMQYVERHYSNNLKHRQIHLENVLLNMQLYYSRLKDTDSQVKISQLYSVVDELKKQVLQEPEYDVFDSKMIISRLDFKSMEKKEVIIDGQKCVSLIPYLDDEQKREIREFDKDEEVFHKHIRIINWCRKRLEKNCVTEDYQDFESDPLALLSYVESLKDNGSGYDAIQIPTLLSIVLFRDFSTLISSEQLDRCVNQILATLEDVESISWYISEFEIMMSVMFQVIETDSRYEDRFMEVLFMYLDNSIHKWLYDRLVAFLASNHSWIVNYGFMYKALNAYCDSHIEGQDVSDLSIDDSKSMLMLLFNSPQEKLLDSYKSICLDNISNVWNDKWDYHNRYIGYETLLSPVVAYTILSAPVDCIGKYIGYFSRYFDNSSKKYLLDQFILEATKHNLYDKFWIVWNALFDTIVSRCNSDSSLLKTYLFNSVYTQFFAFDKNGVVFFRRIVSRIGDDPVVLYSISSICCSIAKQFCLDFLDMICQIVQISNYSLGKDFNHTIANLEIVIESIINEYSEKLKIDRNFHNKIEIVLRFMVSHKSSLAYRQLELL